MDSIYDIIRVSKETVVKFNTKRCMIMCKIYGYCRISTDKQSIERQHRNILAEYPKAIIVNEIFTGTKVEGRKEFNKILNNITKGDTIVFDSVSRMSRNSEEGYTLYEDLFNKGIELVFLKEQHINTSTYKKALLNNIQMTNTNVDFILEGVNKYLLALAKEQIRIAFNQAEKEVEDLHQRTKEGIETARLNGKQIGQLKGAKLTTKKSIEAKEQLLKHSKDFKGSLNDIDVMKLTGLARNTYYKYKKELIQELESK
jgi:DNA invertase Pin-like site-specific DNA recombinase